MTQLYVLTEQYRELQTISDGDCDISDTLEGLEGEFNEKAVSLVKVVNSLDYDIDAINAEIERLKNRKRTIENRQESVREYLRSNMEESGITKIDCPYFSITLAKGRDIVEIYDEKAIPVDYLNIATTVKPMKKELLAALKKKEEVPGARIIKSKPSIRIK